jgi:endogenous inhibitor of DNA gyrase (YacG/DUF329 family)
MENRKGRKENKIRKCEWCGKEFKGGTLFCSNDCVLAHSERWHTEYKSLILKEKVLQKHEELYMKELEMEEKGFNMVKLNVDYSYRFARVDKS